MAVDRLADLIKREQITVFFVTTALFNTLVDLRVDCFDRIRNVLFGGERVSVEHSRKALEYMGKGRIIHMYGPTETTVYASYYFIDNIDAGALTVPIGKPLSNTSIYVLDRYMNPLPVGISGEIYIGGHGTARGYLNNPELTADRFIAHEFHEFHEERKPHLTPNTKHLTLYKTGDLGRWLPDGNIEFLDRIDNQVKIRGFRIELGEIESRLEEIEGIKQSVVIARQRKTGEKYLYAYFVTEKPLDSKEIRNILGKNLPDYMIPSQFIPVERIPLTPNGKIDKRTLLALEFTPTTDYIAPKNKTEKIIAGIWKEVLELEKVGANDNFFEAGGTSLDVIKVSTRIKEALNRDIPVVHIFQYPTVSALAGYFDREETGSGFAGDDRGKAVQRGKEKRKIRSQKKRGKK
jgi:acyl-coenzyme A synthetase/AMP-(fatty) acid ligase/acyl carrier protein